jgi:UDP-N-acetyl-D-mannosaminuronate dehydrogenase
VDAAVIQADHAEYRTLTAADLPGVRTVIDGRAVSSADRWDGAVYRVIGKP